MPSFKSEKLRVNLRLSISRLKLLEKKKSEYCMYCMELCSRGTVARHVPYYVLKDPFTKYWWSY